ncbi:MAG TPA: hypothetical protein VED45_00770, partial [Steroidobacteraceae bacterium]|nr:hypothetical protein [Steroidobacteraceae bacterium]
MKASVLALALLCASPLWAPPAPADEPAHASRMDNLATLLDLTDAQKKVVEPILQDEHAKMHAKMKASFEEAKASGTKPDWQQMKALHQQIQQETLQRLTQTQVLSATQLKKFQILQQ